MLGGISIWQLLIIFVIVILVFGTKKLRNLGGDLGGAVKGFKNAINDDGKKADDEKEATQQASIAHDEKDASFDSTVEKQDAAESKSQEKK